MKKLLSILFAVLIIASSVHLTIAIHYCGNTFERYKVSISGEKASCAMERRVPDCTQHREIGHKCCTDKLATYLVTDNYSPATFHFIKITQNSFATLSGTPSSSGYNFLPLSKTQIAHSPPGDYVPNLVNLSSICIFRI
jgi:hypothetical protein